jgi:hypothetical protein
VLRIEIGIAVLDGVVDERRGDLLAIQFIVFIPPHAE